MSVHTTRMNRYNDTRTNRKTTIYLPFDMYLNNLVIGARSAGWSFVTREQGGGRHKSAGKSQRTQTLLRSTVR